MVLFYIVVIRISQLCKSENLTFSENAGTENDGMTPLMKTLSTGVGSTKQKI